MRKLSMSELGRQSIEEFSVSAKIPIVAVLDNIRSLNNIGSFFRTADAFGIEALYLCGITATPPHRDIHKTALGATESVAWKYFPSVVEAILSLKQDGYRVVCIEQTDESKPLWSFEFDQPTALIFGNEVDGVSDEAISACDLALEIPQSGTKHSLNVSVCGGIVLWHCYAKHF